MFFSQYAKKKKKISPGQTSKIEPNNRQVHSTFILTLKWREKEKKNKRDFFFNNCKEKWLETDGIMKDSQQTIFRSLISVDDVHSPSPTPFIIALLNRLWRKKLVGGKKRGQYWEPVGEDRPPWWDLPALFISQENEQRPTDRTWCCPGDRNTNWPLRIIKKKKEILTKKSQSCEMRVGAATLSCVYRVNNA